MKGNTQATIRKCCLQVQHVHFYKEIYLCSKAGFQRTPKKSEKQSLKNNSIWVQLHFLWFVLPSFHLSGHFVGIVSLVLSRFWHGARNSYEVMHDRARFSGKILFTQKIWKMNQKWAKNKVCLIYWNIWLLVFPKFVL